MNLNDRTMNALQQKVFPCQQSENASLSYTVNWSPVIGTDTIAASTWTGANLTFASPTNTNTTTSAVITGSVGHHVAVNKIVTTAGRIDERLVSLTIVANDGDVRGDY
jgi:transketolase N-terminal domain/subunit